MNVSADSPKSYLSFNINTRYLDSLVLSNKKAFRRKLTTLIFIPVFTRIHEQT